MSIIKEIRKPVEEHIKIFEAVFKENLKSRVPLLNTITRYMVRRKGKEIRPLFVMLSADLCGGVTKSSQHAASLIELLHTATLIHDDVVDDAHQRRGFLSVNAIWKNKISVLVGDFLLSRGLLLALDNKEYNLLHIVSDATREMSEGELLQIEKSRKLDIEEDIYFEIIRKKTASLIASCCAAGAASAGASEEIVNKMYLMGQKIGIAFQIRDDLFDYQSSLATGKPNGIDLKEKKLTLPIIYLLNHLGNGDKRKIMKTIKHHHNDKEKVQEIIDRVNTSGGIEYSSKVMKEYMDEALTILDEFKDCDAKNSLKKLVVYTTERKR